MGPKLLLVLASGLLLGTNGEDQAKGDLEKLQGKWVLTSGVMDGNEIPKDQLKGELIFKGDKYSYTAGDDSGGGKFTINASKKPKTMDAVPAEGPAQGQTVQEIYELTGDNLKICLVLPGPEAKRPTEFKAEAGSGRWLFTYKRAK
jgi:uncharacterized protein (TIGR03067 family)